MLKAADHLSIKTTLPLIRMVYQSVHVVFVCAVMALKFQKEERNSSVPKSAGKMVVFPAPAIIRALMPNMGERFIW